MKRILALCFICFALNGQDKGVIQVPICFVTAETYIALPEGDRLTYTTGLMDGFYASELFSGNKGLVEILSACTKPMDSKQITAIITKHVKEHPEYWHHPVSVQAFNALNLACPGGLRENRSK